MPTRIAAAVLLAMLLSSSAGAQTNSDTSCGQKLSEQLRRFNEQCLAELVTFTASLPKGNARIASEKDKYYVRLVRAGNELQGEAVSKQNLPFVKPETEDALKNLGWTPPEVEFGGYKRVFGEAEVRSGVAARELAKALQAYGLTAGEAISVTVAESDT